MQVQALKQLSVKKKCTKHETFCTWMKRRKTKTSNNKKIRNDRSVKVIMIFFFFGFLRLYLTFCVSWLSCFFFVKFAHFFCNNLQQYLLKQFSHFDFFFLLYLFLAHFFHDVFLICFSKTISWQRLYIYIHFFLASLDLSLSFEFSWRSKKSIVQLVQEFLLKNKMFTNYMRIHTVDEGST